MRATFQNQDNHLEIGRFPEVAAMTAPQTVNIQRQSINQPWGMKICGGRDFRMQLQIKKVRIDTTLISYISINCRVVMLAPLSFTI